MEFDKFKHLEQFTNELDEVDKVRFLQFISQSLFKENKPLPINDILYIGDTIQKIEITCATIKKIILDTEIKDAVCPLCKKTLPCMLLKHHLLGMNKECPHNEFEMIDDETYLNLLNKSKN